MSARLNPSLRHEILTTVAPPFPYLFCGAGPTVKRPIGRERRTAGGWESGSGWKPVPTLDTDLYKRYSHAIRGERLPLALVDMDAVDRNIETLAAPVRRAGKTLRLASKSIRCPALIRYILDRGGGTIRGLMAYAAEEAAFLLAQGFDDLLVAYPTVQDSDLLLLAASNRERPHIALVADCVEHLERADGAAREARSIIPILIEADLSYRPLGGILHLGVRRSPLRTPGAVVEMAERVAAYPNLSLKGVMGYEGQIAGVGEANPHSPLLNPARRLIKRLSVPRVCEARARIAGLLADRGIRIAVFNGGGTGSLSSTVGEAAVTEVTAGSGFLSGHLFDYYPRLDLVPALFFALQVVRRSDPRIVTCHGGGYVASGEAGRDRLPLPALPPGLKLLPFEGAGEVQTPLLLPPGVALGLGDPVFFRHAKAGEPAEHFNEYLFVRGDRVEQRALTYRGYGRCPL